MSRIGILGGSFDPPHNAHIMMARVASQTIPLEKVLFMPAPEPPHKTAREMTPYDVRARMVELAIQGEAAMALSLMEEFRHGPSYTVDLLEFYRKRHDDEIYLIMGADSVEDLPGWKEPQRILRLATLVVFARTNHPPIVPVEGDASVVLFEQPVMDISSTDIRARIRAGREVGDMLPRPVHQFILDNSLYC